MIKLREYIDLNHNGKVKDFCDEWGIKSSALIRARIKSAPNEWFVHDDEIVRLHEQRKSPLPVYKVKNYKDHANMYLAIIKNEHGGDNERTFNLLDELFISKRKEMNKTTWVLKDGSKIIHNSIEGFKL